MTSGPTDDRLAATIAALGERSGALRVAALLDCGDQEEPLALEWVPGNPSPAAEPLALPPIKPIGGIHLHLERGEIVGPMGGAEHLARAVRAAGDHLGGRSVITAQFPTEDDDAPLAISYRAGEPIVLVLGDEFFEAPEGWPVVR